jgi:hypothetical protein
MVSPLCCGQVRSYEFLTGQLAELWVSIYPDDIFMAATGEQSQGQCLKQHL